MLRVFFLVSSLVSPGVIWAQRNLDIEYVENIEPLHYVAQRSLGSIVIDGKLDEPSWQRAQWTPAFVDIEGDRKERPAFLTRAKMLWDDKYFYIAADLEEPHVWATLTKRDAVIYRDNDFEVFIDPDGDTHLYYEFEINAHGTEWDLLLAKPYRDGGPYINAWYIDGLKTAVQVWGTINDPSDTDQGWSVEMAFPLHVLQQANSRRGPLAGQIWRVNFSRVQWELEVVEGGYAKVPGRSEDNWVWSPQGLINMHYPEKWGYVLFADEPAGSDGVSFVKPAREKAWSTLRSIYYRQRRFRAERGHYTVHVDSIGLENPVLKDFLWPPSIQVTNHSFEATLEEVTDLDEDGSISHYGISSDGRIWKR